MKYLIPLLPLALVAGCDVSESDVRTASEAAMAAEIVDESKAEHKKTQDFDSIAKESVEGVDTAALESLQRHLGTRKDVW